MRKISEKFIEILNKVSTFFAKNVALNIISSAFMTIIPIIMIGSFVALFKGVDILGYQEWLQGPGIKLYQLLDTVYLFTVGFIALYITFNIGYRFANRKGLGNQAISIGLMCIVAFLIITPFNFAEGYGPAMIPSTWLGATGMFMAIIVGFIVGFIFKFTVDKKIVIKLPDSVPAEVSNQFTAIIPGVFVILVFMFINYIFSLTSFGNAQDVVYGMIKIPLSMISSSIFGYFLLMMFMYLLWFFGIHGGMTVGPIIMMMFFEVQMANLTAFQEGVPLPNWVTGSHVGIGTGALPLLVAMLLVCKSKANSSITKLAIIPAFFGVDEPAYFGIPMILNPIFFLPWVVIVPVITIFGTYLLQAIGLLPFANGFQVPANAPFFIQNLLSYGWRGCIVSLIFFVISVLIYIPFIKVYDKQCLVKELENENVVQ